MRNKALAHLMVALTQGWILIWIIHNHMLHNWAGLDCMMAGFLFLAIGGVFHVVIQEA